VFALLPLVHISWADGKVQRGERAVILQLCEARGIEPGTRPFLLLESLLEERPSDEFLEETLSLVQQLLAARGESTSDVIDLCHRVADASGGLLGLGARVSEKERALMEHVADTLGETAQARFREKLA
jgi:tellurite resistance protein